MGQLCRLAKREEEDHQQVDVSIQGVSPSLFVWFVTCLNARHMKAAARSQSF
jgi:hypothetical protein